MRHEEKQRTKEAASSSTESGNTSVCFEKSQWLVVLLCRRSVFSAVTGIELVSVP